MRSSFNMRKVSQTDQNSFEATVDSIFKLEDEIMSNPSLTSYQKEIKDLVDEVMEIQIKIEEVEDDTSKEVSLRIRREMEKVMPQMQHIIHGFLIKERSLEILVAMWNHVCDQYRNKVGGPGCQVRMISTKMFTNEEESIKEGGSTNKLKTMRSSFNMKKISHIYEDIKIRMQTLQEKVMENYFIPESISNARKFTSAIVYNRVQNAMDPYMIKTGIMLEKFMNQEETIESFVEMWNQLCTIYINQVDGSDCRIKN